MCDNKITEKILQLSFNVDGVYATSISVLPMRPCIFDNVRLLAEN